MGTKIQHGDTLTLQAGSSAIVGGNAYLVGGHFGVAVADAAAYEFYALQTEGVFELPKVASTTVNPGDVLYWDSANSVLTPVAKSAAPVAIATELSSSSSSVVRAKLLGFKLGGSGKIVSVVTPTGGYTAFTPAILGSLFVIPLETKLATEVCKVQIGGVATLTKVTADTIDPGQKVYWDTAQGKVTETSTSNWLIGASCETAGSSATTVKVSLNGITITQEAGA